MVFGIVVIIRSPADEEEDHGEHHKHHEDGAGVDIDGKDCQSCQ